MNWKLDIKQLAEELPKLHKHFFHNITEKDFYDRVEKLKSIEKDLSIYSMVVELSKLVALAEDAHTALELPKNNMLPIVCYWFEEGIYIIGTNPEFQGVLHKKVVEIDGIPISEVIEKITEIISHENKQFVKSRLPESLVCADILYGLGIAKSVENLEIKTEGMDGKQISLLMTTIKYKEWENLSDPETIPIEAKNSKGENLPLFRKNKDLYYWLEEIEESKTLYVNYKKCKEMENLPIENFIFNLKEKLEIDLRIENIVLDFRNNNGGNSELLKPFIEWVSDFQKVRNVNSKRPFKIFVIVGRDTFSSALLNVYVLKFKTKAIFVGEATGGKPNCYGEVNYFKLKESGLSVRYSTKYYYIIEEYWQDSFYPDYNFKVSFRDYLECVDPCMEWVKMEVLHNEQ